MIYVQRGGKRRAVEPEEEPTRTAEEEAEVGYEDGTDHAQAAIDDLQTTLANDALDTLREAVRFAGKGRLPTRRLFQALDGKVKDTVTTHTAVMRAWGYLQAMIDVFGLDRVDTLRRY